MQVVDSVLLGHEFGGVVDEVSEYHESPHEHFSDFEIEGRDFVSKMGGLVDKAFLVLLIVNFVLFGHHVVVVQLKTLEIVLDVKFGGFVRNLHRAGVADTAISSKVALFCRSPKNYHLTKSLLSKY